MPHLPNEVDTVIAALRGEGYSPYLVGGCVREMLRGRAPSDYDMPSDAPPQEVLRIFGESAHPTGLPHGTVTVVSGGMPSERRCSTAGPSFMSLPWTFKPMPCSTSASGLIETPPMPAKCAHFPGTR